MGKLNNKIPQHSPEDSPEESPEKSPRQKLSFIDKDGLEHSVQDRVCTESGRSLLEIILDSSIEISHVCGGMGTCGTCRVFVDVKSGFTPPIEEVEAEIASARGFSKGISGQERLSCQVTLPCEAFDWCVSIPEDPPQ